MVTFAVWSLWALFFLFFHLKSGFENRNAITCGDHRALFSRGQGVDRLSYHLFDDGRLAITAIGERYPFRPGNPRHSVPASNTLRIIDRSSGRTVSSRIATIDGRWATIGRAFAWSDQLLVWNYIESYDPETRISSRIYRRFLTDGETQTEITDNAAFEPRAVDENHQLLASLEERQRVMGGQPTEYELSPQTVRIESLAGSEPNTVATFPIRRALRFYFDDGALIVLRWESGTPWRDRSDLYRIFLDRHDPPDYATTWTTELTPRPTSRGSGPNGPRFKVAQGQSVGRFALRYEDYVGGVITRHVQVNTASGEILVSSVEDKRTGRNAASPSPDDGLIVRGYGSRRCVYEASVVD